MTAALYCRVSTDEQAEHGFSLEVQEERLKAFALSQGWNDFEVYVDDGYTGKNLDRPAMQRLLHHIEAGHINAVCVYKLDRISRRQIHVLHLLEDVFEPNGVAFKSVTESIDTTTSFGKAMIGILAVFAQLERETIIERTTGGRRRRVQKGLWYGGRIPFGYDWDKDNQRLVINPSQAQIVRQIYNRYLSGESYNSIADWAAEQTSDRIFTHNIVRDILIRPIYMGKMNNAGTLVNGLHEPIVDEDIWHRANKEKAERAEGKTPAGDYLLTGLIRCGTCGSRGIHIIQKSHKGKYTYGYYVCKTHHVRPKGTKHECSMDQKRDNRLEESVIARLRQMSGELDLLEEEIRSQSRRVDNEEWIADDIESKIKDVERQLQRWYDAWGRETFDPEIIESRIASLEEEKKRLMRRFSEIEMPRSKQIDTVIESLTLINEAWDYMTLAEQQTVLRSALKHVIIHYKTYDVTPVWNV